MQKQVLIPSFSRYSRLGIPLKKFGAKLLFSAAFIVGSLAAVESKAQNTIVAEGFESGLNGWTIVNGTQTNKYYVGTAAAASGTQSAYISSDGGVTNGYDVNAASVVHLYKDVTIPASQKNITLTFKWRTIGEGTSSSDYDNLKVFLTNPATTLNAGTEISFTDRIGATWYNNSSATAYTTTTIALPNSYSGTTKRLVFSWKNDASSGTMPSLSVDDISFTSANAVPLTGTYTINSTLPTGGTNFASFTDAINSLNSDGIAGPVTFNVAAGQTFTENAPAITMTGTATNTITFQKSGTGVNPMVRPTGTTGSSDAGIIISGGDYFTFDGIDINISTGSAVEYGYLVRNASATDGAMNNTIRNASITLNRTNTSSIGVVQSSSTSFGAGLTPTALSGINQNNTFSNLIIQNVYSGILLVSGTSSFPDNNTIVSNNTVGAATAGDLGGGSTTTFGIKATLQNNVKIFNNEIRNITTTTAAIDGLYLDQGLGISEIYRNNIHDIALSTATGTAVLTGMRVNLFNAAGYSSRVYNNMVTGFSHAFNGTASATRRIVGIFVQSNGTGVGSTHNIDFNSVRIETPATYTASNAALEVGTTSGTTINVRNNILANFSAAQTGVAKHYVWVTTSASLTGIAGSVSNYNLLYLANTTNGAIGLTNTTDRLTLGNWQGATNQDVNSKSSNPQFISASDLHINPTAPTEVESNGSYMNGAITWVPNDYDNAVRNTSTPDIGADEGTFTPADFTGPVITYAILGKSVSLTTNRTFTATIVDPAGVPITGALVPRVYFSKDLILANFVSTPGVLTSGTATNGTWTFTIDYSLLGGVTATDQIAYYVVAQDNLGNIGSTPGGISGTNVNTITGGSNVYTYTFGAAIPALVTVPGTYPSLTLAGGLFAAINAGVLNSNVVVQITGDLTAETGANQLNKWSEEGTGNYTLTIRPDGATNRTISGVGATAGLGLIRIVSAERVTLDGSFNGAGRYLTLTNTGTSTPVTLQVAFTSDVNIKNLNISTGINTTSSTAIVVNSGNNANLLIENNNITKAYTGISVSTPANSISTGLVIRNNTIGSATAADYVAVRGITMINATNALITGNTISVKTAVAANIAGIELGALTTENRIDANTISGVVNTNTSGYGAYGVNILGGIGNTISNNMISDISMVNYDNTTTTWNPFGIRIEGGTNHKIYHNSVNMFGPLLAPTATHFSAPLLVVNNTVTGLDIRNNIFANTMVGITSGKSYAIYAPTGTTFATINYNDYYVSGANGFVGFLGSNRLTLADWKVATGQDVNSVSIDPQFVSSTDLHIPATNTALDNLGTAVSISTDFDNQPRNTVTPDLGADEFGAIAAATLTAGGPTTFCQGGSVVLTATSTLPGVTYQYRLNGTPITGATNATFTATTSGSYTVTTTSGNSSATSTAMVVTVNSSATPTVTAGGPTTFCSGGGGSVVLTAASTNTGATFQWFNNGTAIAGATSATFTANASGSYTVVATANGCPSAASTATAVSVGSTAATPTVTVAGATTFCSGGSVNLTAASTTTGATYQWFRNGTIITGATSATYSATLAGAYTAVASSNGCPSAASAATTVTVTAAAATPTVTASGATSLCTGGSVTLTAASTSTGATYQWFNNGTIITGATATTFTANAAGSFTVVATAGGCPSTASTATVVTLNTAAATPTVTAAGATTFCTGGSVNLTAASTTTGSTFQWFKNGTIITGATAATYNATQAGSYTAVATANGCPSAASTATTITLNSPAATPTVTAAGATTFCSGGSVTLTAASTTSGATYQWFNNAVAISGATSATYTANAAGVYTVVATATGCPSAASTATTVTVNAAPAIPTITLGAGSTTTICQGTSAALTGASSTSGATYTWSLNGSPITGATAATYNATAAGSYTVTATNASGCTATSTATVITVTPAPTTPTISQNGGTLTSSAATGNQWYLNGVLIPGATGATYVTAANGNYTVVVTSNGCSSPASAVKTVTNTGVGANLAGMSVAVYPNPATGSFNVKLNGYQKDATVVLYNLAGQQILKGSVAADGNAKNINIKGLAAGTYLLKVTSDKGVQVTRIIVQ